MGRRIGHTALWCIWYGNGLVEDGGMYGHVVRPYSLEQEKDGPKWTGAIYSYRSELVAKYN